MNELTRAGVIYSGYQKAQVRIENIVWEIEKIGVPVSEAEFKRLKNLQSQLDQTTKQLERMGQKTIPKGINAAYRNIQLEYADAITDVLPADMQFKASFSTIDQQKVIIYADQIITDLNDATRGATKRVNNIIRRTALLGETDAKITQELQTSQIAGESIRQMAGVVSKIIQQEIGKNKGVVVVRGKDGITRRYRLDKYAETVVRTRTREVATAAVKQTMSQASEKLGVDPIVEITRHADESDICKGWLNNSVNNRFALVPNHPIYPYFDTAGGGGPPWHPNCIHVTTPYIPDDF